MVKKTKKHSLLKQAATPKRIKRPPSSADNASQHQAQQDEPSRQGAPQRTKPKGKLGQIILFTLLALLAIFMLMPKPQLITYQKLGLVASSIYVPTLLGGPTLVDSELYLQSIDANKAMYLCRDRTQADTCHRYEIIKQEGFFAVLVHLFSS
ncbi:hypothetical protein CWC05_07110 [Pseudoalteromonas ruthenica]|uniref:Uncharacterized protein n=1 Tax=Pseudoalteromonas ruthenica TaxID=151081 RepID=A0A5S3Z5W8_9GAMM|nr:hypothetical protein [Pseudoalteromonas sp. CO325X]RZF80683.1 hypothetical protein EXT46_11775 [Pseudoalteromonas sp. CO325X]TMP87618.1 hypothetical protein CWC05_07110 [Pseudoalteromonas ruthenica]